MHRSWVKPHLTLPLRAGSERVPHSTEPLTQASPQPSIAISLPYPQPSVEISLPYPQPLAQVQWEEDEF